MLMFSGSHGTFETSISGPIKIFRIFWQKQWKYESLETWINGSGIFWKARPIYQVGWKHPWMQDCNPNRWFEGIPLKEVAFRTPVKLPSNELHWYHLKSFSLDLQILPMYMFLLPFTLTAYFPKSSIIYSGYL